MLAQVSVEFIVFLSFLLILVFLIVYQNTQTFAYLEEYKTYQEAQKTADSIASEINLALKTGNGYTRKFYVNENIYGIGNFTIEVDNYEVKLKWDKGEVISTILTKNITGEVKVGENVIRNVDGKIYIQ